MNTTLVAPVDIYRFIAPTNALELRTYLLGEHYTDAVIGFCTTIPGLADTIVDDIRIDNLDNHEAIANMIGSHIKFFSHYLGALKN